MHTHAVIGAAGERHRASDATDLLMNIVYFITGIATKQARYET